MIRKSNRFFVFSFALCLTLSQLSGRLAQAAGVRKADLSVQLEALFSTLENNYGPLQLKQTTIGLDWEETKRQSRIKLDSSTDTRDFYFLFAELLASFNDAHVSVKLPSNLVKRLPFALVSAEGDLFVSQYQEDPMTKAGCAISLGDKLLSFSGQTLRNMQARSPVFSKYGNDLTNLAMFGKLLTTMPESIGLRGVKDLPNFVDIRFQRSDARATEYSCLLPVASQGIGLMTRPIAKAPLTHAPAMFGFDTFRKKIAELFQRFNTVLTEAEMQQLYRVQSLIEQHARLVNLSAPLDLVAEEQSNRSIGNSFEIGAQLPFFALPPDFKPFNPGPIGLILNSNSLYAGTFNLFGKRVGFLRIPHYAPQILPTINFSIRHYINYLEKNSDLLIIDQTNNPGGYVVYSDLWVKALVKDFDTTKHLNFMVKPTQGFLRSYAELSDELSREAGAVLSPEERLQLQKELNDNQAIVEAAYLAGDNLSKPISMLPITKFFEKSLDNLVGGIPVVSQLLSYWLGYDILAPQTYTKPVYMMINELDFSGGDATPASLQDYGRVKLIGVRTAGAGGSVEAFSSKLAETFDFNLTTSLMWRKGNRYVENYGVTPDLHLALTREDVKNSYATFFSRVLEIVAKDQALAIKATNKRP